MEKNSLKIVKSNKLIEASYRLTLDEQRLILSCIGQIYSIGDLSKQDSFVVTAKDFSRYSGIDIKSSYQQLEAAAQDLYERSVTFYDQETDDILVTRWVSGVKYNSRRGDVELYFANGIRNSPSSIFIALMGLLLNSVLSILKHIWTRKSLNCLLLSLPVLLIFFIIISTSDLFNNFSSSNFTAFRSLITFKLLRQYLSFSLFLWYL